MNSYERIAKIIESGSPLEARDRARVAAAFRTHRAALVAYASDVLDGTSDAEDVVHNVFLLLVEGERALPPVGVDRVLRALVRSVSAWWIYKETGPRRAEGNGDAQPSPR